MMSGWCPSASATSPTLFTKASASLKFLNLNARSILRASSMSFHSGVCFRQVSAPSRESGGTPPRQAVQDFAARSVMQASALSLRILRLTAMRKHSGWFALQEGTIHGRRLFDDREILSLDCRFSDPDDRSDGAINGPDPRRPAQGQSFPLP